MSAAAGLMRAGRGLVRRSVDEAYFADVLRRAGLVPIGEPAELVRMARDARAYGMLGALSSVSGRRFREQTAVVDERGELTYGQLDSRVNALANALAARGVEPGDGIAILARNHRGFLEALLASARLGARIILLNTDFAGPQIREVAEREGTRLLIHDDEYAPLLEGVDPPLGRVRAWADEPGADTIDSLVRASDDSPPPATDVEAKVIVLTSGTTGTPKGAPRQQPRSLAPVGALLSKVPLEVRETTVVCAPLFHALGLAHAVLGVALGSTIVLRRRFDPARALLDISEQRATAAILVPVMLRRMLDLGPEAREGLELGQLRVLFLSGSLLGAELCERALEAFGPVVYNLYGSTEVAYATIGTPDELARAPDSVGTPPRGATVRLYDEQGRAIGEPNVSGRIFVGNGFEFEGYTGGGHKESIDGLFSTGDVGHFDETGLLYVDGRDDEMIVSGGENVFPAEVEDLLLRHDGIVDAAVVGAPDEDWGERLRAFVVRAEGGEELDEEAVRAYVRDNLARYKVPRDVVFLDELPRNPTGKVLKRELAEL